MFLFLQVIVLIYLFVHIFYYVFNGINTENGLRTHTLNDAGDIDTREGKTGSAQAQETERERERERKSQREKEGGRDTAVARERKQKVETWKRS